MTLLRSIGIGALVIACGKGPRSNPPIDWHRHLETATALARRENKPLFLFFEASWDCAGKQLQHVTFVDPEIRNLMTELVAVDIDCTEEEPEAEKLKDRFKIVGIPTILVVTADDEPVELLRFNEYVEPRRLAHGLQRAYWEHRELSHRPTPLAH